MRTFVGTSGYSYKEWKGSFFPDDLPASKMLGFYAARFNTVEINNTFYRMPAPAMVAKWAEQVPEAFVFALKAPQSITHRRQLNDAGDAVAFFWKTARELGPKLGPVLFQMPPFFKKDLGRLRDFLRQLPEDCRAAFEFRHPSWFADDVYDVLKTAGAPLCLADTDDEEPPLVATGSWGYLRLRRSGYDAEKLRTWVQRIRSQPWESAYVFFKHEDEGKGPQFAAQFNEALQS
ncbi:MAG TPA: DUF72 domain-containing protein [Myxococcaceae bacterium]|nr:DUF72 domain-containing protein [Myxococcaceae bacterium]